MAEFDGLKQRDIKPCVLCGKGVMHKGDIVFYRVTVQQFVVIPGNVQQQTGLEMMLGGSAMLANVMGPDADMAQAPASADEALVCMPCALSQDTPVAMLAEKLAQETEETEDG